MKGPDLGISTKFFGLSKLDVDNYFNTLTNNQEKEINDLSELIKKLTKEKDKLAAELQNAQKEDVRYEEEVEPSSHASNDLVEDALKRVEKTLALINMLADEEANQLIEKANQKLAEYDKTLDILKDEIDENKERIEALLGEVLKLLKSNVSNADTKQKDPPKEKRRSEISSEIEKLELEIEKPLENRLERERLDRITADGTSLSNIQKLFFFQKKYANKEEEVQKEVQAPPKSAKTKQEEELDMLFSSLGDTEYLDKIDEYESEYDKNHDQDDEEYERVEQQEAEVQMQTMHGIPGSPVPGSAMPMSDDNIKKMRNTLIIGKIAGEDLLDSNNRAIIRKGKVLTEEDILLAEKETKLPELIINMVFPE